MELLARHVVGDWGDLGEEDRRENERFVRQGPRMMSAYGTLDDPDRLWVITEAGAGESGVQGTTTILRPDEVASVEGLVEVLAESLGVGQRPGTG